MGIRKSDNDIYNGVDVVDTHIDRGADAVGMVLLGSGMILM